LEYFQLDEDPKRIYDKVMKGNIL